jgi:hypothetical protein
MMSEPLNSAGFTRVAGPMRESDIPARQGHASAALGSNRLLGLLGREGYLIGTASFFLAFLCFMPHWLLMSDSWLTLVGGRELVAHGIPHHDQLAVVSHGHTWVDQQWLSQLAYWGIYSGTGLRGAVLATILVQVLALGLAFALARRRGASATSIAPFALISFLYLVSFMRAEVFSTALFVVVLGLLAAESRQPSRRVWLVFPLLVLWANVHGAVVIGVLLVSMLGGCEVAALIGKRSQSRRDWLRAVTLTVIPVLTPIVTPWGERTVSYYRSTIGNPVLRKSASEWMPPELMSLKGFALFPLAAVAIILATKRRRDLSSFELGALVLTLIAAFAAIRSAPWFAYACIVLLPPLLERTRKHRDREEPTWLGVGFAAGLLVCASVAFATVALAPTSKLTSNWPADAEAAVTHVLRVDSGARVLAGPEQGDWLLFRSPEARGRLAFDGRWEILSQSQMRAVVDYLDQRGDGWERLARGYRLVVLDPHRLRLTKTYERRHGVRVLYRDRNVVVYDRGRTAD